MNTNQSGPTWTIEYGKLTSAQIRAGQDKYTLCNLNILLSFNSKPVINIIGCRIILDRYGDYRIQVASDKSNGYFNYVGFDLKTEVAIIKKALRLEQEGKLVDKWTARFDYNPKKKAQKTQDQTEMQVQGSGVQVTGFSQSKTGEPVFNG